MQMRRQVSLNLKHACHLEISYLFKITHGQVTVVGFKFLEKAVEGPTYKLQQRYYLRNNGREISPQPVVRSSINLSVERPASSPW